MIRNIIKYGIYLIVLIYIIRIINPTISDNIKNFINTILNSDENLIIGNISSLIKIIKNFFKIDKLKMFDNLFDDETKLNNIFNDETKLNNIFNDETNLNNIFNDNKVINSSNDNN